MNPLKTITISGTNNTYAIPVLDIDDNVNIDLPDAGSSNGVSSEELQNHNSSSTAHEDIRAEINELSNAINGVIITVHADEWVSQEDGTYTNTIAVDGIDADTTYDVNLYGEYTEEQATAFSELIASIATTDNQIIVTASESVAVELKLLLRGKIDFSDQSIVYVKDLEASRISYDNSSSNLDATDIQGALDELDSDVNELNSKISQLTLLLDTTLSSGITYKNLNDTLRNYKKIIVMGIDNDLAVGYAEIPTELFMTSAVSIYVRALNQYWATVSIARDSDTGISCNVREIQGWSSVGIRVYGSKIF